MASIYIPNSEKDFFAPFGPTMAYYKMPGELVTALNDCMTEKLADHSANLVGKVSEELLFGEHAIKTAGNGLKEIIVEYHAYTRERQTFGKYDKTKHSYNLQIAAGWFVRQFEGEYNPLHIHTGSTLSCVGYLKLPDGIENEWNDDYKDHHPSHGHLQFAHGTDTHYSFSNFMVKPRVGDFYIFPSYMFHCVYPFYTPGERRSFSMNMIVHEQAVD